jgi:hypothetical protein
MAPYEEAYKDMQRKENQRLALFSQVFILPAFAMQSMWFDHCDYYVMQSLEGTTNVCLVCILQTFYCT